MKHKSLGPLSTEYIEAYARQKQIELAESVQGRAKIYLDTKFWIILRERKTSAASTLYGLLSNGVKNGQLFCPVSGSTFMEVTKQKNTHTRRIGTAKLIDELSLGVSLMPGAVRAATEFAHFWDSYNSKTDIYKVSELIWTKVGYSLGYLFPSTKELSLEENFALQKCVFDKLWNAKLVSVFEKISEPPEEEYLSFQRIAEKLSEDIHSYSHSLKSYQQVYNDEVAGALDLLGDEFIAFVCNRARKEGVTAPIENSREWRDSRREICNVVGNLLRLSPDARRMFPTIHIEASLHAALRWNKGRNFKANDFHDFEHATSALAYCDAFFTENSLSQLVTSNHTRLHEINNCEVTSDLDVAIDMTKQVIDYSV